MLPPGPRTPAFWQTLRFGASPREYSQALSARYGLVTRFRALNGKGVAVSDPELAREVFAADPATFETLPVMAQLFGNLSVLSTHGPTHKRQRKLLNPRFHGARVKTFLDTMQRVVREHLLALRKAASEGKVVVMSDLAQALTLDIIIETVFGESVGVERPLARAILQRLIHALSPAFVFAKRLRAPFYPPWRTFLRRRSQFDAWVDAMIALRRDRGALGGDILGLLLEARYDDGSAMEDVEIRDRLMTLLLAGHETTAIALAWGVYWLLRDPPALARLRAEIDALGPEPRAEALARLPFLEAVISETLRIEPVVSDVARVCREPLKLGPWTVPPGEFVIVNASAILSSPALFPEPSRFRPERFLEKGFHAGEFMPFGGGSRRCLGAAFAEAELAIALASLVGEWDLALADDAPERAVRRNITMGPKRGVRVRVLGARAVPARDPAAREAAPAASSSGG
jgi:cytochrome P450 family 110